MEIRTALIGCGYWGPHFIRICKESTYLKLIKVCDINKTVIDKFKKLHEDINFTLSIKEIVDDQSIQAVIISTPVKTHFQLAKKCLLAKKHVLCEKPLSYTSKESEELIKIARKNKVTLMTGHIFEFNQVVRYMKNLLLGNKIGDVLYINMFRTGLGPIRQDVNVVYDLASHDISILNYLFDSTPIAISAIGRSFISKKQDDIAIINFEYPNDIIASLTVSWMDPIKQRLIKIVGTKAMLMFDDVSTTEKLKMVRTGKSYQSLKADFGSFQLSTIDGDITIPNIKYPEPLRIEVDHFTDCIVKNKKPETDGESGLRVVKVLEAVNKALKTKGKRIIVR